MCIVFKKRELKANRIIIQDTKLIKLKIYEALLAFENEKKKDNFLLPLIKEMPTAFTKAEEESVL